jgi:hyaluronoglucosaminidase
MTDHLVPRPRQLRIDDATVRAVPHRLAETALVGLGPDSEAWRRLADERPEELGAEGYVLRITGDGHGTRVILTAPTEAGLFRGRATLQQLADAGAPVPALTIRDWPHLARRGVVEGFYGPPWSHDERLDFLRFAGRVGLNEYVYAPKDDPYHRERWRDPYPEATLAEIAQLAREAAARHVRFVYTIAPALSMRFSDDAEHELLAAKAEQLWGAGIRSFALLFDDVPGELIHREDIAAFADVRQVPGEFPSPPWRDRAVGDVPHGVRRMLAVAIPGWARRDASGRRPGDVDRFGHRRGRDHAGGHRRRRLEFSPSAAALGQLSRQ